MDIIQQLFKEIMQPVLVGVETMSINKLKCLANDFLQQRRGVLDTVLQHDFSRELMPSKLEANFSSNLKKKCEGLPLAIVAISGVLATKDSSRIDDYGSLGAELEGNDRLETEGFVIAIEGKTIEEVTNGYLNELFKRSLILVAERHLDGRPYKFHIHNLMRETIVSKAREKNIGNNMQTRLKEVGEEDYECPPGSEEYFQTISPQLLIASLRELLKRGSRLLNVLDLAGCNKLRDDPLQSLQELPNLAQLMLEQTYKEEGLCFKAGGFQRLKDLFLSKLKGLRWVRVEKGAMSHLEILEIKNSELMEEVPSGIEHLTNLQTFELGDMSKKLISKLDREVQDRDYWKIAHIPQVRIRYLVPGQSKVKFL
ncbi:hypothetical protein ACSBR2_014154 [Camellia fascicularis]